MPKNNSLFFFYQLQENFFASRFRKDLFAISIMEDFLQNYCQLLISGEKKTCLVNFFQNTKKMS